MKFAITADVHLSRYGQDKVESKSNLPERLHSIKGALYNVADYCYDNDIPMVVIAGDLIHTKSLIYTIAQKLILDYFDQYEDLEFIVLDGNHDLAGKGQNEISSLRFLQNIKNVEWVTQAPAGNGDVLWIPYSYDIVNQVKSNHSKILISHFGLSEAMLNSGISIVSDISLRSLVNQYDLVLLGHYHKPQEIITEDIRLFYVGSGIQLDWGEKGDEKRFLVVDTDTLDVQSIPTTGYKKHIELEIDSSNKSKVLEEAGKAKEKGHHIKILKTENISIESDEFRIIDKTERDITNRGIDSSMSMEDKHKQYLSIRDIPEDEREEYLKVALEEILQDCEEL